MNTFKRFTSYCEFRTESWWLLNRECRIYVKAWIIYTNSFSIHHPIMYVFYMFIACSCMSWIIFSAISPTDSWNENSSSQIDKVKEFMFTISDHQCGTLLLNYFWNTVLDTHAFHDIYVLIPGCRGAMKVRSMIWLISKYTIEIQLWSPAYIQYVVSWVYLVLQVDNSMSGTAYFKQPISQG